MRCQPETVESFSYAYIRYVCEKCGHEFDKFQLMADKPLTACPKDVCPKKKWGKGKVKKKISAGAGLIFKGSGFLHHGLSQRELQGRGEEGRQRVEFVEFLHEQRQQDGETGGEREQARGED